MIAFSMAMQSSRYSSSRSASAASIIEKGLRQKPELIVNSTNAPPCSLQLCSKLRPSSITMTFAPAPTSAEVISCSATDLPEPDLPNTATLRSEEHTSELQSLMRISYAVFCLKQKPTYI